MKKLEVEGKKFLKISQNWTNEIEKFQNSLKV